MVHVKSLRIAPGACAGTVQGEDASCGHLGVDTNLKELPPLLLQQNVLLLLSLSLLLLQLLLQLLL